MTRLKPATLMMAASMAAAAIAGAASAALIVSYRHDGLYAGSTSVNRDLSDSGCKPLPLTGIEIRDGALRAYERRRQTVRGLITHSGFFNADYYFIDGGNVVFEGTVDREGKLTGAIMRGRCVWLVEMARQR